MSLPWEQRFSKRAQHVKGSAVRELLKITEQPEFISFGGGLPAPDVFPVDAVARAAEHVLSTNAAYALQYSTTEGYRPLRRWIAEKLSRDNLALSEENILITSGSQQALDLIGKLLIDPDDQVVVESPTYLATLQCWRTYGARFLECPADDDGFITGALPSLLVSNPKLMYSVPNFQNPRGVTLSLPRRRDLVSLLREFDVPLIEDDPYGELRFEGQHLPSLMAIDGSRRAHKVYNGLVIGLGSFSKVLAPGLRVGWVAAAPSVIEKLVLVKQGTDLHTATFNQMIVHHLAESGIMESHRRLIIEAYRARRDVMLEALAREMPQGVTWTRPQGGMFLWVTLPSDVDAADVLPLALERKVAFVCGAPFHAGGGGKNTMRLNFSNATFDKIREGIHRLGEAVRLVLASHPAAAA
jgi:2-aminoadipate transaminase